MCISVGRHRWQASKGEGGPSRQEAVKVSSSYEDQTVGQTFLKASAATVLKVWVTVKDTRETHTYTHFCNPPKGHYVGVYVSLTELMCKVKMCAYASARILSPTPFLNRTDPL